MYSISYQPFQESLCIYASPMVNRSPMFGSKDSLPPNWFVCRLTSWNSPTLPPKKWRSRASNQSAAVASSRVRFQRSGHCPHALLPGHHRSAVELRHAEAWRPPADAPGSQGQSPVDYSWGSHLFTLETLGFGDASYPPTWQRSW